MVLSHCLTYSIGHKHLRPKSIHDSEILDEFSKDYMYLACIQFINSVRLSAVFISMNMW